MKYTDKVTIISLLIMVCPLVMGRAETKVIANWNIVPLQIFDANRNIGVVAFHETGVDVEFFVNGQSVGRVSDPTFNRESGVYEYWITIDPSQYNDGPIIIGAQAYPDDDIHFTRILQNVTFYANSDGSLTNDQVKWADCDAGDDETGDGSEDNPYRTIEKAYVEVGAEGTVFLKKGSNYRITQLYPAVNYQYWTTITCAPGLSRNDIRIAGYTEDNSGRFGENMVRWKDITMYKDAPPGYSVMQYFESTHHIWMDGVELYDARGQWNGGNIFGGNSGYRVYVTGSYIHDIANTTGLYYLKDVYIKDICSDIYRGMNNLLGVNVVVNGIDPGPTEAHPDFIQFYNPDVIVENVILYNNRCYNMGAQGLFGHNCRDVAFVNLVLEKDPPDSYAISQFGEVWDHILLWHVTTVDQGILLRGDITLKTNFNVQNNILHTFSPNDTSTSLQDSVIAHNIYNRLVWNQTSGPMGTDVIIGDPIFVSVEDDDYRIAEDSPARSAGVPLPGVPADINGNLYDPVSPSLGAFEYGYEDTPVVPEDIEDINNNDTDKTVLDAMWDPSKNFIKAYNNILKPNDVDYVYIICNVIQSAHLTVIIFDSKGNEIKTLKNEFINFGEYKLRWYGKDNSGNFVGSGIYMLHMKSGEYTETRKIAIVK